MPWSRVFTALLGLAAGLVVSAVVWTYFGTPALFVFLPFVPFLFWRLGGSRGRDDERSIRRCPICGFATENSTYEYCPRDGHRLDGPDTADLRATSGR